MQTRLAVLCLALIAFAACQDEVPTSSQLSPQETSLARGADPKGAGPPLHAEMDFGIEAGAVGSPFPPAQHDRSFHSYDMLRPRTVIIRAGGTVTFEVYPLHQPAVFEPGTQPEEIDTENTEPIVIGGATLPFPLVRITDSDGRIALGPPQSFAETEWTVTFDSPGRYLVICTTWAHFVEAKMYGWVIVQ